MASRPVDIIRLLDFMLHDWKDQAAIDPARIGFFGFSKGGYTGLVLAGVRPDFGRFAEFCKDNTGACEQLHDGENSARSATRCAHPGRGDCRSGDRGLHAGKSGRHQHPAAVLAIRTGGPGRRSTVRDGAPRQQPAGRTRHSRQPGRSLCIPGALFAANSRLRCRAFAPIRRASIARHFTASSTRALSRCLPRTSRSWRPNSLMIVTEWACPEVTCGLSVV